jgi:UMF1 family MFS transporter
LFGALAARVGPRPAIFLGLSAYVAIAGVGYFARTATHFFVLAVLIGTVMGGTQALSRSLFASLIPRHKSSEYFAFFGVFDKFAGVLGPALFAASVGLFGSSRPALLGLVAFFVVGGALLSRVDVAEGRRAARAAEPPQVGALAAG